MEIPSSNRAFGLPRLFWAQEQAFQVGMNRLKRMNEASYTWLWKSSEAKLEHNGVRPDGWHTLLWLVFAIVSTSCWDTIMQDFCIEILKLKIAWDNLGVCGNWMLLQGFEPWPGSLPTIWHLNTTYVLQGSLHIRQHWCLYGCSRRNSWGHGANQGWFTQAALQIIVVATNLLIKHEIRPCIIPTVFSWLDLVELTCNNAKLLALLCYRYAWYGMVWYGISTCIQILIITVYKWIQHIYWL